MKADRNDAKLPAWLHFPGTSLIVPKFGKLKPKTCKPTINCSGINTTKVDSHSSSCWYLLLLTFLHSVTTFNLDCSQETRLSQILLDAQRESEIQLMSSEPAHWSPPSVNFNLTLSSRLIQTWIKVWLGSRGKRLDVTAASPPFEASSDATRLLRRVKPSWSDPKRLELQLGVLMVEPTCLIGSGSH